MKEFLTDLKQKIASYFVFTSGEKRGTIYIIVILIALSAGIVIENYLPKKTTDFTEFEAAVSKLKLIDVSKNYNQPIDETDSNKRYFKNAFPENDFKKTEPELFVFDPNNLPEDDWKKLGLTEKQAHVIKNYESHGGHFYKKEDLKKIFCITDAIYARLQPFIQIKNAEQLTSPKFDSTDNASRSHAVIAKTPAKIIDINTATQEQLESLQGIGKWIATNIIKFREKLGGYYAKEQLREVKFITDSVYAIIQPQVYVNTMYVKMININSNDLNQLKHAYLDYASAKTLLAYRKNHGDFKTTDEIAKLKFIDPASFEKLKPYLKFSDE